MRKVKQTIHVGREKRVVEVEEKPKAEPKPEKKPAKDDSEK